MILSFFPTYSKGSWQAVAAVINPPPSYISHPKARAGWEVTGALDGVSVLGTTVDGR